jgi:hypothetical protein
MDVIIIVKGRDHTRPLAVYEPRAIQPDGATSSGPVHYFNDNNCYMSYYSSN